MVEINKAEYGLDDDSIAGLTVYECYVLSHEMADVEHQILDGKPFNRMVRAENKRRIERCCNDLKRKYSLRWLSEDQSEAWLMLRVE